MHSYINDINRFLKQENKSGFGVLKNLLRRENPNT